jgi:hypothetical protein
MTLDDIQHSVYHGQKGVEQAFKIVEAYLEKKKEDLPNVSRALRIAKKKLEDIPPGVINQISVTERYRDYFKKILPEGKINDTKAEGVKLLDRIREDLNHRILDAKEPSTKRNREYEKNEITKFFRSNFSSIVDLLDLYNLLHDIKIEINK